MADFIFDSLHGVKYQKVLCELDLTVTNMLKAGRSEVKVNIEDNAYTKKQRGALHLWCKLCADLLNEAGETRKGKSKITGEPIEYPWTESAFKAFYKDVLFEYTSKISTEEQSSADPSDVQMIICNYFGHRGYVLPPWPSSRG